MAVHEKHYVVFYSPGTFFSEQSSREIDSWDTKKAVAIAETITERYAAKPYGFQFETRLVSDPVPDGRGGELEVASKVIKKSGTIFIGGKLLTLHEVRNRNLDDEKILASNMAGNGWYIVCVNTNSWKSTMPFGAEDFVVGPGGEILDCGDDPKHVRYRQKADEMVKREREEYLKK